MSHFSDLGALAARSIQRRAELRQLHAKKVRGGAGLRPTIGRHISAHSDMVKRANVCDDWHNSRRNGLIIGYISGVAKTREEGE